MQKKNFDMYCTYVAYYPSFRGVYISKQTFWQVQIFFFGWVGWGCSDAAHPSAIIISSVWE